MLTPKGWILVLDKGEDVEGGRGELAFNGPGEVWRSKSHCNTVPLGSADFYCRQFQGEKSTTGYHQFYWDRQNSMEALALQEVNKNYLDLSISQSQFGWEGVSLVHL